MLQNSITNLFLAHCMMERRQGFCNEITIRDSNALRWSTEFAKQDPNLFTVMSHVPRFNHMHSQHIPSDALSA
ncbi:hypothetical protein BD410DRAFT_790450 [Rickenella mellea]|uniref:Uncharacterized protein n=1 Tax=Rickenella mellea TaxID=50990 RepID=A0A4Y7Q0L8_9AGAM|nr:hypothetical protein BD410DRAFT_790450 [Rickenella mellea]